MIFFELIINEFGRGSKKFSLYWVNARVYGKPARDRKD